MPANVPDLERMKDRRLAMALLVVANTTGFLASTIVIGFAASKDQALAMHLTQAVRHAMRMFVTGAFIAILPAMFCWVEIEFDVSPSQRIVRWSMNVVVLVSGVLFLIAGLNLTQGLVRVFRVF